MLNQYGEEVNVDARGVSYSGMDTQHWMKSSDVGRLAGVQLEGSTKPQAEGLDAFTRASREEDIRTFTDEQKKTPQSDAMVRMLGDPSAMAKAYLQWQQDAKQAEIMLTRPTDFSDEDKQAMFHKLLLDRGIVDDSESVNAFDTLDEALGGNKGDRLGNAMGFFKKFDEMPTVDEQVSLMDKLYEPYTREEEEAKAFGKKAYALWCKNKLENESWLTEKFYGSLDAPKAESQIDDDINRKITSFENGWRFEKEGDKTQLTTDEGDTIQAPIPHDKPRDELKSEIIDDRIIKRYNEATAHAHSLMAARKLLPFMNGSQRELVRMAERGEDLSEYQGLFNLMKSDDREMLYSVIAAIRPAYDGNAVGEFIHRTGSGLRGLTRSVGYASAGLYTKVFHPELLHKLEEDIINEKHFRAAITDEQYAHAKNFFSKAIMGFADSLSFQVVFLGGASLKMAGSKAMTKNPLVGIGLYTAGGLMDGFGTLSMVGQEFENMLVNGVTTDDAVAVSLCAGIFDAWVEKWNMETWFGLNLSPAELRLLGMRSILHASARMDGKLLLASLKTNAKQCLLVTMSELGEEVVQGMNAQGALDVARGRSLLQSYLKSDVVDAGADSLVAALPTCTAFGFTGSFINMRSNALRHSQAIGLYNQLLNQVARKRVIREGTERSNALNMTEAKVRLQNEANTHFRAMQKMTAQERKAYFDSHKFTIDERSFYEQYNDLYDTLAKMDGKAITESELEGTVNLAAYERGGVTFQFDNDSHEIVGLTLEDGTKLTIDTSAITLESITDNELKAFIEQFNRDKGKNEQALPRIEHKSDVEGWSKEDKLRLNKALLRINGSATEGGGLRIHLLAQGEPYIDENGNIEHDEQGRVKRHVIDGVLAHELSHKLFEALKNRTDATSRKKLAAALGVDIKFFGKNIGTQDHDEAIAKTVERDAAQIIEAQNDAAKNNPEKLDTTAVIKNVIRAFTHVLTFGKYQASYDSAFSGGAQLQAINPLKLFDQTLHLATLSYAASVKAKMDAREAKRQRKIALRQKAKEAAQAQAQAKATATTEAQAMTNDAQSQDEPTKIMTDKERKSYEKLWEKLLNQRDKEDAQADKSKNDLHKKCASLKAKFESARDKLASCPPTASDSIKAKVNEDYRKAKIAYLEAAYVDAIANGSSEDIRAALLEMQRLIAYEETGDEAIDEAKLTERHDYEDVWKHLLEERDYSQWWNAALNTLDTSEAHQIDEALERDEHSRSETLSQFQLLLHNKALFGEDGALNRATLDQRIAEAKRTLDATREKVKAIHQDTNATIAKASALRAWRKARMYYLRMSLLQAIAEDNTASQETLLEAIDEANENAKMRRSIRLKSNREMAFIQTVDAQIQAEEKWLFEHAHKSLKERKEAYKSLQASMKATKAKRQSLIKELRKLKTTKGMRATETVELNGRIKYLNPKIHTDYMRKLRALTNQIHAMNDKTYELMGINALLGIDPGARETYLKETQRRKLVSTVRAATATRASDYATAEAIEENDDALYGALAIIDSPHLPLMSKTDYKRLISARHPEYSPKQVQAYTEGVYPIDGELTKNIGKMRRIFAPNSNSLETITRRNSPEDMIGKTNNHGRIYNDASEVFEDIASDLAMVEKEKQNRKDEADRLYHEACEEAVSDYRAAVYDIEGNGIRYSIADRDDPRSNITKVRGGWTKPKIIRELKRLSCRRGRYAMIRCMATFDNAEEMREHMFYHGTSNSIQGGLKASIALPKKIVEAQGGGGYGAQYYGISVSKSKRVASHFSGIHSHVSIYPIILSKQAKVIEMKEAQDASDVEEHIVELWNQGVDAVWIGDRTQATSEQELLIINPEAIVTMDASDDYAVYGLGTARNPLNIADTTQIEKIFSEAKTYEQRRDEIAAPRKITFIDNYLKDHFPNDTKENREHVAEALSAYYQDERVIRNQALIDHVGKAIRFSIGNDNQINGIHYSIVNDEGSLVAIHNIYARKILEALRLGGLVMPSIAITKPTLSHTNFGNISLIFSRKTIDPQANKANEVYGGDAWTPTFPEVKVSPTVDEVEHIHALMLEAQRLNPNTAIDPQKYTVDKIASRYADYYEEVLDINNLINNRDIQKAYTTVYGDNPKTTYEEWFYGLFANSKKGIRNKKDVFTPTGNRRNFKALYDPYTAANVLKAMLSVQKIGNGTLGGAIKGASMQSYKTVKAIHANEDRLQLIDKEDFKLKGEDIIDAFLDAAYELTKTGYSDGAQKAIIEAVSKHGDNAKKIKQYLSQWPDVFDATDEVVNDIVDIVHSIRDLPTAYFEAKPRRIVDFSEVKAAFIPLGQENDSIVQKLESRGIDVQRYDSTIKEARSNAINDYIDGHAQTQGDEAIRFSIVSDADTIQKLENAPKRKVYHSMQLIDGKLYPSMSARINKQLDKPVELGRWIQADEHPELARATLNSKGQTVYKFDLDKGNGTTLKGVNYNPYLHSTTSPLNDQFSSAWKRPNLVTVEMELSDYDITSGYHAPKANAAVGEHDWHSGTVSSQLAKLSPNSERRIWLSRYGKVLRVVPNSEVADKIAQLLVPLKIHVPYKVVTPSLRAELEAKGVQVDGDTIQPPLDSAQTRFSIEGWNDGWSYDPEGRAIVNSLAQSIIENKRLPTLKQVNRMAKNKACHASPESLIALATQQAQSQLDNYRKLKNNPKLAKRLEDYQLMERVGNALELAARSAAKHTRLQTQANEALERSITRQVNMVRGEDYQAMVAREGLDIDAILLAMQPSDKAPQIRLSSRQDNDNATNEKIYLTPAMLEQARNRAQTAIERGKILAEQARSNATKIQEERAKKAAASALKDQLKTHSEADLDADEGEIDEQDETEEMMTNAFYKAIKESGITLDDVVGVVQLIKAITEQYIHDNPDVVGNVDLEHLWESPVVIALFAHNISNFAQEVAQAYSPSEARIRIAKLCQTLEQTQATTLQSIEATAERIFADLNRDCIRQTRHALIGEIKRLLRPHARHHADNQMNQDRTVSSDVSKWCKLAMRVMRMNNARIEARAQELEHLLDDYAQDSEVDDAQRYKDYQEAQLELALMDMFGGINKMMPSSIVVLRDTVEQIVNESKFEMMNFGEAFEQARSIHADAMSSAIVGNPKLQGRMPERQDQSILYSLVGMMTTKAQQLTRFCKNGQQRQTALKSFDAIESLIHEAEDAKANALSEAKSQFITIVKKVYGSTAKAASVLTHQLPDQQAKLLNRGNQITQWTIGRVMQMYVSCVQSDYASNTAKYGRDGSYIRLLEKILIDNNPANMDFIQAMRDFYLKQGDTLNEALKASTGTQLLTPNRNYMPVKMMRDKAIARKSASRAYSPFAPSLTPRVKNGLDFDQSADIVDIFIDRIESTAHTIGYASRGSMILGVTQSDRVLNAIRQSHGREIMSQWNNYILDIVAGKPESNAGREASFINFMARTTSRLWLMLNPASWIKQLAGVPCYGLARNGSLKEVGSSLMFCALHPIEAYSVMKELAGTKAFQARYGSSINQEMKYARDDTPLQGYMSRFFDWGMKGVTKLDSIGVYLLAGIYRQRRADFEKTMQDKNEASEAASAWVMHIVDATMQTTRTINTTQLQRAGGAWNVLLQFKSAPVQQTQFELAAIQDALASPSETKRWKKAAAVITINHILVPVFTTTIQALLTCLTSWGMPDDEKRQKLLAMLIANMISGSLGSIVFIGSIIEGVAGMISQASTGQKVTFRNEFGDVIPISGGLDQFINSGDKAITAITSLTDGEIQDAAIEMADALAQLNWVTRTASKTIKSYQNNN